MTYVDPRMVQLAKMLVSHSVKVKPGDVVHVAVHGFSAVPLSSCVSEEIVNAGGIPQVRITDDSMSSALSERGTVEVLEKYAAIQLAAMKQCDCYVSISAGLNPYEGSDMAADRRQLVNKVFNEVQEYRVKNLRWVVLKYPTTYFAASNQMSMATAEDFFYRVCNADYAYMAEAVKPLKDLMDRTDKVKITGKDTSLTFSIKGIDSIPCCGELNVPDGECFTAPVRESVNGIITFNAPTVYQSSSFSGICLEFKDGKIIQAYAPTDSETEDLNDILDSDEGARYVGEFAIGFNPYILTPMRSILFDEKIAGSIHMAMGRCYDEASNGNSSTIHWDMIHIQRPEYGGGQIYFDGRLIRDDGIFVVPELEGLNPNNYQS